MKTLFLLFWLKNNIEIMKKGKNKKTFFFRDSFWVKVRAHSSYGEWLRRLRHHAEFFRHGAASPGCVGTAGIRPRVATP